MLSTAIFVLTPLMGLIAGKLRWWDLLIMPLIMLVWWILGWFQTSISGGQKGNVWVLGFQTGLAMPGGSAAWCLPGFMRLRIQPMTPFKVAINTGTGTNGLMINAEAAPDKINWYPANPAALFTSSPTNTGTTGATPEQVPKVDVLVKTILTVWIRDSKDANGIIGASWDKDIPIDEQIKKISAYTTAGTKGLIRTAIAVCGYNVLITNALPATHKDAIRLEINNHPDFKLGLSALVLDIEKGDIANPEVKHALTGAVEEQGQRSKELADQKTFGELTKAYYDELVQHGMLKDDQNTWAEARRLAELTQKKRQPAQEIIQRGGSGPVIVGTNNH